MSRSRDGLSKEEWASIVCSVLADHPDWVAATTEAMTAGVVQAVDRQRDRAMTLSLGLVAAVGNPVRGKKRNHDHVIDAIQVSQFAETAWAETAIEREKQNRDRKQTT